MSHTVTVEEATEATSGLLEALNALIPQLSRSASPMSTSDLTEIVSSPASHLLIARVAGHPPVDAATRGGQVVGMLTLVAFRIPTGVRAWIEDVVVDQKIRGARIGEALVVEAIRLAMSLGARTVDLTSRPSRTAAHKLYTRSGFTPRETSVYRWTGG